MNIGHIALHEFPLLLAHMEAVSDPPSGFFAKSERSPGIQELFFKELVILNDMNALLNIFEGIQAL